MRNSINILQLNTWMGKVEGNLGRFLESHDFDIICMQEVMHSDDAEHHLACLCFDATRLAKASGLEHSFFSPIWQSKMADGHLQLGNLILSRFPFKTTASEFIHGRFIPDMVLGKNIKYNNLNVQIVTLENGLTVVNHHGFWCTDPMGNVESVKAFEKLAKIVKPCSDDAPLVLCGDLNVVHRSPAMRPLDFLRDLTDENKVKSTLSGLKFDGAVACDHIMINDKIKVNKFIVHDELVSDHKAVSAEIML